jgi:TatA/E family protein of Tat protein translocase
MDFFGIGPFEIILILLIGFLIFGPKKLYEISRNTGKIMRDLNRNTRDLSTRLQDELEENSSTKPERDQKDKQSDAN